MRLKIKQKLLWIPDAGTPDIWMNVDNDYFD